MGQGGGGGGEQKRMPVMLVSCYNYLQPCTCIHFDDFSEAVASFIKVLKQPVQNGWPREIDTGNQLRGKAMQFYMRDDSSRPGQ